MSILLDALRKSEKDQQRVEAPSIHSIEKHGPVPGFLKNGWVLLFIVVLFAGASYAWYQYQKSDDAPLITDTLTPDTGDIENKQAVKTAKGEKADDRLAMVGSDATNRQRTPVEAYQQPAGKAKPPKSTNQVTQAAKGGNNKPVANKTAANKAAARKAAAKKAAADKAAARKAAAKKASADKVAAWRAAAKKAAADKAAARKAAANKVAADKAAARKAAANKAAANKPAADKPGTAKPVAAGQKKFRPQPPAPINYWELPNAIRARVPEMKFTVLVFAQKPADRFVLINGQRFRQGEQVQPELFVREIQREGVVFKYRLYQFLVER